MAYRTDQELKPVEWRNNLCTGVASMDDEHKLLIGVLNLIISSLGSSMQYTVADRTLRDLFAYADYHFEHEEELMETYDYPEMVSHKAQHDLFTARLRELDGGLNDGTATVEDLARFVMSWFVAHIMILDTQLGTFLAERMTPELSPFEFEHPAHQQWDGLTRVLSAR